MAKQVKLIDIASKLGVSTVTVSKALSNQKGVSEELRAKIIELADEMGYKQPSAVRRENHKQKEYQIGVLIQQTFLEKYDSFYWLMYQRVNTQALGYGCFCQLEVVTKEMELEGTLPKIVTEHRVDGLLTIGQMEEVFLHNLKFNSGIPVVYMDYTDGLPTTDAVVSDSYYGAYHLTNYLLSMGHREIAFVGTIQGTPSITDRFFGYCKALLDRGLTPRMDWQINDRRKGEGIIDLIRLPDQMPTAFFCNCDLAAAVLVQQLEEKGYRVPEDISVAGFDNYLHPGLCNVRITTYEVDQIAMAKQAVKILLKRMNRDEYPYGTHAVEGHLVIKDSVMSREG
ncbi:MAG: LacI family DNA-binding transcriptional regulator [Acetatifactor sp.]